MPLIMVHVLTYIAIKLYGIIALADLGPLVLGYIGSTVYSDIYESAGNLHHLVS